MAMHSASSAHGDFAEHGDTRAAISALLVSDPESLVKLRFFFPLLGECLLRALAEDPISTASDREVNVRSIIEQINRDYGFFSFRLFDESERLPCRPKLHLVRWFVRFNGRGDRGCPKPSPPVSFYLEIMLADLCLCIKLS